jgi:HAD superfamily hydrolase (TIGR01509 family)
MKIDTVLFDWDGTLIDTAPMAFAAFQKTFIELGFPLAAEQYHEIYAPDWRQMYRALQLPLEKWDEADQLWLQHYKNDAPELADGCKCLLDQLAGKYDLGIVTSGTRERVRREAEELSLLELFKNVVSGDDVQNKKPHPEGLLVAMKFFGKTPQSCCYVGDSPDDIVMGKRAGMTTIGIQSRYPGSQRILAAKPDFLIGSLPDLMNIITC